MVLQPVQAQSIEDVQAALTILISRTVLMNVRTVGLASICTYRTRLVGPVCM